MRERKGGKNKWNETVKWGKGKNRSEGRTDQREETKKVDADETEKFGSSVYIVVFN